jgi:two-component system C4-dicarboxylate transport sensor histidine kinase DctB
MRVPAWLAPRPTLAVELHAGVENDARMMNRRAASRSAAPRPSGGGVDLTRPRWPVLVAAVAIVLVWMALVFATYNAVVDSGLDQLRRTSRQRLDFLSAVTGQTLQKYESMPYVLSQQGELIDLLEHPGDARRVRSVNDYLKRVREKTEPLAVYLLNSKGMAIASSNWSEPGTFVGQDYSFRPYFLQAMQRQAGRFYGVGTTTAEPGYFLSYPLLPRDADLLASMVAPTPIGVVVVKISLGDLEQAWSEGADRVALADADGIVFLSSESSWRYRTLAPLTADTQQGLLQTRQYGDSVLRALPIRPSRPAWGSVTAAAAPTDLIQVCGERARAVDADSRGRAAGLEAPLAQQHRSGIHGRTQRRRCDGPRPGTRRTVDIHDLAAAQPVAGTASREDRAAARPR